MENTQIIIENSKDVVATFTTLSLDALIIIAIFVLFFGYGLKFGKHKIVSLILSFYLAFALYFHLPYIAQLIFFSDTAVQIFISKIIIFIVLLFISDFILKRMLYTEFSHGYIRRFFEAGVLSIGATILALAFAHRVIPIESIHSFGAPIADLFSSATFFFWWLIIPLMILFFTTRRG